jgi:dynein heavy chain
MDVAIFDFAVGHVLRICRVMKMVRGNAMLIGLGGSGRSTLVKLASIVCDYDIFTVDITK